MSSQMGKLSPEDNALCARLSKAQTGVVQPSLRLGPNESQVMSRNGVRPRPEGMCTGDRTAQPNEDAACGLHPGLLLGESRH